MTQLSGRTAIITGAGSGIGRATAIALAARGARIVVGDIDFASVEKTADTISLNNGTAMALACDVATDSCFEELRDATLARFGQIDVIVNNVGVLTRGLPDRVPLSEWRRVLDINLFSVVRSNLTFLPLLLAQESGHIVNVASFAGLYTYAFDRLPYAAAKAAIVQISEGLALYLKPKGLHVTCLCPGPVETNIAKNVPTFGEPIATRGPGEQFRMMDPALVGTLVVDAIEKNRFLVPTDEAVWPLLRERVNNWDAFLSAMADSIVLKT